MEQVRTRSSESAPKIIFSICINALGAVRKWVSGALQTLQHARMMQALIELNDTQLAEIGIERCDIPRYAEELLSDGE